MNANYVVRSGSERRQKNVFMLVEVRRTGVERRRHGRTAGEMYASLQATWNRIFHSS